MEMIIAWDLKKVYTEDDFVEMIEDFYNEYKYNLDYPTIKEYIEDCFGGSVKDETSEEAYWEYLINEFNLFIHNNEDLYTIKTIKV